MGPRVFEIILGVLMCYIGYSSFYKNGWSFLYGQPVPRFASLVVMAFGVFLIIFSSYKIIKLIRNREKEVRS